MPGLLILFLTNDVRKCPVKVFQNGICLTCSKVPCFKPMIAHERGVLEYSNSLTYWDMILSCSIMWAISFCILIR